MLPTKERAEEILRESERMNPGPWGDPPEILRKRWKEICMKQWNKRPFIFNLQNSERTHRIPSGIRLSGTPTGFNTCYFSCNFVIRRINRLGTYPFLSAFFLQFFLLFYNEQGRYIKQSDCSHECPEFFKCKIPYESCCS